MIYCSKCGEKLSDDALFCHKCGSEVIKSADDADALSAAKKPKEKKKGKGARILIIILILIIICGGIAALFYFDIISLGSRDKPDDTSMPKPHATMEITTKEPADEDSNPIDNDNDPDSGDELMGLPYDFVPINDLEKNHPCQEFGDKGEFMDALTDRLWLYYETNKNPKAKEFNGGYVDMAGNFTMAFTPSFEFYDNYQCTYKELDPADLQSVAGNVFDNTYVIEWLEGCNMAYVDTDIRIEYNSGTYMVMWLFYIDTAGDLVETLAINNVMDDKLIYIANMNIYFEYNPDIDTVPEGGIYASDTQYYSKSEFENAILNTYWQFSHQESSSIEADIGHDEYFSDYEGIYLEYNVSDNNKLYYHGYDETSGAEIWNGSHDYTIGDGYLFVSTGGNITYNGREYEQGMYYYINTDGYLVERWVIRDIEADLFLFTTPSNIFTAIAAIEF